MSELAAYANQNLAVALPALLRIRMAGVGTIWNMVPTSVVYTHRMRAGSSLIALGMFIFRKYEL